MPKVIGVKFKKTPKIYYFEAGDHDYSSGCGVIVETARGVEFGRVALLPVEVSDDKIVAPLKPIIRIATDEDVAQHERMEAKREEAMKLAHEKINKSGLDMKLVDAKYTFDGTKLILYFTADGRVDFRELVRELASVFHVRIELRQIGSRDECKMVGGMGPCGRPCCCSDYNLEYSHVSIKMAKNQNLALNPGKINGLCGNLMCCLGYENEYYSEVNKLMPKVGSDVTLKDGRTGVVGAINQLKKTVTVKFEDKEDSVTFAELPLEELVFKPREEKLEKPEQFDESDKEQTNQDKELDDDRAEKNEKRKKPFKRHDKPPKSPEKSDKDREQRQSKPPQKPQRQPEKAHKQADRESKREEN